MADDSDATAQAAADQAAQQQAAAQQAAAAQQTQQASQAAQSSGAVTSVPQNPDNFGFNNVPKNYNPQGAMGGTFAPAYIPGYAPSEAAVAKWQSGRAGGGNMSLADIQSTAMPAPWTPPNNRTAYGYGGGGQYGPNLANTGTYTFGQGSYVDPQALKAVAQNLPYDLQGRRDAVAAAVAQNAAAQAAYNQQQQANPYAYLYGGY